MKIISHHCRFSGGNVYICGPDDGGTALIIDPGAFPRELIEVLTFHRYELGAVVITHPEEPMIHAVETIARVYRIEVFGGVDRIGSIPCRNITEEEELEIAGLPVHAIPMPAHSRESVVYRMEEVFFTGPIIHAGTLGRTVNAYAQALMVSTVRDRMARFGESSVILPGIGPATTIRAELNLTPFYRAEVDDIRV